jgi:hypothetical protein
MTAHYTHVGTEAARRAVALLPDVTGTDTPATATPPATGTLGGLGAILDGLRSLDNDGLQAVITAAKAQLKKGGSK